MRSEKKDYTSVKQLLDEALFEYNYKGGHTMEKYRKKNKLGLPRFGHNTDFCCMQQPKDSVTCGYYVIHHMERYVRARKTFTDHADITKWGKSLQQLSGDCKDEFRRIQEKFASIINQDVVDATGIFNGGASTPEEREARLKGQANDIPHLYKSVADARPASSEYNRSER